MALVSTGTVTDSNHHPLPISRQQRPLPAEHFLHIWTWWGSGVAAGVCKLVFRTNGVMRGVISALCRAPGALCSPEMRSIPGDHRSSQWGVPHGERIQQTSGGGFKENKKCDQWFKKYIRLHVKQWWLHSTSRRCMFHSLKAQLKTLCRQRGRGTGLLVPETKDSYTTQTTFNNYLNTKY